MTHSGHSTSVQLDRRNRTAGAIVAALVGVVLIVGFTVTGSPARRRALAADATRISHLQNIASALTLKTVAVPPPPVDVPESLDALRAKQDVWLPEASTRDPETRAPYEYRKLSATTVELCATFQLPTPPEEELEPWEVPGAFWEHPAGRRCWTIDATSSIPGVAEPMRVL